MNVQNWKIYDKKGSNLNLIGDSYLNLVFTSNNGVEANGYAITDPSNLIVGTYIQNSGHGYDPATTVQIDYTFSSNGQPIDVDASIFFVDVSIFNPVPTVSQGIGSVTIDSSTEWIYPSVTYGGAIFLDPVSQGLIETEHLTIFENDTSLGYISPWDASNSTLVFRMVGDEEQIKLFTLDDNSQEIIWADELIFDLSTYVVGQGLQINIGFKSEDEGVFERRLVAYSRINGSDYPLMELVMNAQSIGKDERYDTLLDNFGLYHPESIPQLFKEVNINEDLPDWQILNYKAKQLILEYDEIMPYIGTYKALINAIKWLGYEDIKVKEWFQNVKEGTKLSLFVPYDADGRKRTIKTFSADERKNLKKLNQLSLIYCINRETGEVDEWGNPETENCYEYNLNEILIKLYSLKQWLEKNIIGVNARIWDLTGEGVYLERYQNFIYGTQNQGTDANYTQSLTPDTVYPNSELVTGDASILLTLKEYKNITIEDLQHDIIDFARYGWDPSNGFFSPEDYVNLSYKDPSAVFIGSPFSSPWADLYDIQWKLSVDKAYAGVLTTDFVTNALLIRDNEIKFYNYFDTSTLFFDVSANVDVTIQKGTLRDPSIDIWEDSIAYSIYPNLFIRMDTSTAKTFTVDGSYAVIDGSGTIYNDTSVYSFNIVTKPVYFVIDGCAYVVADTSTKIESPIQNGYTLESSTGQLWNFNSEFSLQTSTNPQLMYAFDDNYLAPLFSIDGYKWTDSTGGSHDLERNYFLALEDGKIKMENNATQYITVPGLLDFDGVNDNVRMFPQPAIEGTNTFSFNIFFESYTATTDVFMVFSSGNDVNDYLMVSYRPAVKQLFVATKRIGGMSGYDISHLIDKHAFIEIKKGIGTITSVKANGENLTLLFSGLTGPWNTTETYVGYHTAYDPPWKYLNHALVWDLTIEGKNHWTGYPAGNTNGAWVDTIGSLDGTVLGSPTTTDASYPNTEYGSSETQYINFNYDTSLDEQKVSLVVSYTSPRMPIFTYDPSDASTLYYNGGDTSSIVLIDDNSVYRMDVNHAGNYEVEIYGWNGQNNLFFNFDRDGYDVWQKYPTITAYIDTSCAGNVVSSCTSTYLTAADVSALIDRYPVFDRIIPLQGLTLEYDIQGMPYIRIPSITYFQDVPGANSISRYYNLTERFTAISGTSITIDEDFQSFYVGDEINLVQFNKGDYSFLQEASASIVTISNPNNPTIGTIDNAPTIGWAIDPSTIWYALNGTERPLSNGVNSIGFNTFTCDISNYVFGVNQLVAILVKDPSGNQWGSSFRVLDSSTTNDSSFGYTHIFKGNVPEFTLDPSFYTLTAKHAFSAYSDFSIDVASATEVGNDFLVYLDDTYYHQYYLDNTFVFLSINFDQNLVLQQWYDPSTDASLLGPSWYPFDHSIKLDISTLVILKAEYDTPNYMLGQKNIWTIIEHDSSTLIMEVWNETVSYIFDEVGEYDVQVESYDIYGNLKTQLFEGLIKITDA